MANIFKRNEDGKAVVIRPDVEAELLPELLATVGLAAASPSEAKASNPKDAVGTAKVPLLSVLPLRVLSGLALALLEGARKYGRHNYRACGVRASVYVDAVGRHVAAWYEGQDTDPDSGLSHIDKAIASLVVLRDSMYQGNWVDDRPPASDENWITESNAKAKAIIEKISDAKPALTKVSA